MTRTLAVLALAGVAGAGVLSAGSSSAQMTVSIIVARSCAVDVRPAEQATPQLRLTCTAGAQSTLKVDETTYAPTAPATAAGDKLLTLNF
jgi:hypothetical protein